MINTDINTASLQLDDEKVISTKDQQDNTSADLNDIISGLTELSVQPKEPKTDTLFWAVDVNNDYDDVFAHDQIASELLRNDSLNKNKEIHTTLLFVGAKYTPFEEKYKSLENESATLIIDAYGISDCALALRVKSVVCNSTILVKDGIIQKYTDDEPYSHVSKQHITLALKKGTAPKDSVLTLDNPDGIILLDKPMELVGFMRCYRKK